MGVAFRPRLIHSEEEFTASISAARGTVFEQLFQQHCKTIAPRLPFTSHLLAQHHVFRLSCTLFLRDYVSLFLFSFSSSSSASSSQTCARNIFFSPCQFLKIFFASFLRGTIPLWTVFDTFRVVILAKKENS